MGASATRWSGLSTASRRRARSHGWAAVKPPRWPCRSRDSSRARIRRTPPRGYTVLAGVYEELGDLSRAGELYELAEELLRDRNPSRFLANAYAKLAEVAEQQGRTDEAYAYLKKAVGMQHEVGGRERPSLPIGYSST
jgi:tetratricopeptide (TPR) repeat protein